MVAILFNKQDRQLIRDIALRAYGMARKAEIRGWDRLSIAAALDTAHAKNPIALDLLLKADDANFAHDVFGIVKHLDWVSGDYLDCFSPRFDRRFHPVTP